MTKVIKDSRLNGMEQVKNNKWSVCFAGEAGKGIDKTAVLFGKILASYGYSVFIYRDYGSLIRGGHNFSIATISQTDILSHEDSFDLLLAYDKNSVEIHKDGLKIGGQVFAANDFGIEAINLNQDKITKESGASGNFGNNIGCGALMKHFGIPFEFFAAAAEKQFGDRADIVKELGRIGYEEATTKFQLPLGDEKRIVIDGSEAGAKAISAIGGIPAFYYPMTPATGLFERLQEDSKCDVFQVDDEVGAINAAAGAAFSRGIALTGSSGGGIALMGEGVSFIGIAELPVVIYFAQRQGPSTGVPTYSEQADLKFALNLGPGEFPKIVVSAGDAKGMYELTEEAFYLAQKYRCPVTILSDKNIAENYFSVRESDLKLREIAKDLQRGALPGLTTVRASSYEHNEEGFTIEDAESVQAANERRLKKMELIKEDVNDNFEMTRTYGEGENLIIFTGSVKGAIIDNLPENYRAMEIKYLEPFPGETVAAEIKKAKRAMTVEMNATGLLSQIIAEKTGLATEKLLKYDGRPIVKKDLEKLS